jgi:hypothetical protein
MSLSIEECRRRLGPAPRRFSIVDWAYLTIDPPPFVRCRPDGYAIVYRDQREVRARGNVVWGALVQANFMLFEPGPHDVPALVLYTLDPSFDDRPDELQSAANRLFELKGKQGLAPEAQRVGDIIAAESTPKLRAPVPSSLVGARDAFLASIVVHRKHLPLGYLSGRWLPLLVCAEASDAAIVVPSRYWPDALLDRWTSSQRREESSS